MVHTAGIGGRDSLIYSSMRRLAPSTPIDAAVSVGEADIVLSWSTPAIGVPDGYHVEHGELDSDERQWQRATPT